MKTPLDNPIWSSLVSRHRPLALGAGELLRYPGDVAPFLGVPARTSPSAAALTALVAADETVFTLGPRPEPPPGWEIEDLGAILQMVGDARPDVPDDGPPIIELDAPHRPSVGALAALVYPHYFRARTTDLGRYFGVYEGGTLAAMIGERMGMPGYREISAVCTHPAFSGRGLARRLLAFLGADIAARGETPFLHVSPDNTRAVALYERNGYRVRLPIAFAALRRSSSTGREAPA
jgi:ribosomal protein S18 acetylase RimI-like enzyme